MEAAWLGNREALPEALLSRATHGCCARRPTLLLPAAHLGRPILRLARHHERLGMRLEAERSCKSATGGSTEMQPSVRDQASTNCRRASLPTLIGASDEPLLMGTFQAEAPSARRQRSSSLLGSMLNPVSVNSYSQSPLQVRTAMSQEWDSPSTLVHAVCAMRRTHLASQQVLERFRH